jgi:hypothetical protein
MMRQRCRHCNGWCGVGPGEHDRSPARVPGNQPTPRADDARVADSHNGARRVLSGALPFPMPASSASIRRVDGPEVDRDFLLAAAASEEIGAGNLVIGLVANRHVPLAFIEEATRAGAGIGKLIWLSRPFIQRVAVDYKVAHRFSPFQRFDRQAY